MTTRDRNAADLLGARADGVDAEALRVGAGNQQHDLAGALVVAGAARIREVGCAGR